MTRDDQGLLWMTRDVWNDLGRQGLLGITGMTEMTRND